MRQMLWGQTVLPAIIFHTFSALASLKHYLLFNLWKYVLFSHLALVHCACNFSTTGVFVALVIEDDLIGLACLYEILRRIMI
ncbi:hypothetical protein AAC387_Pa02g0162 [Persea americana]